MPIVSILAYHKIGVPPAGGWESWFYVPEPTFASHLQRLYDDAWEPIDLGHFLNSLARPDILPDRAALLTFDDAYRSMRTTALPWLERFGAPAVLFVPTDHVGGRNVFDSGVEPDEALCDWADLRALAAARVAIQSHGASHRRFSELSRDEREAEILRSKSTIEAHIGVNVDTIAFPYGDPGVDHETLLASAGYRAAFLYGGGPLRAGRTDPFRLPRIAMGPDTDLRAELDAALQATGRARAVTETRAAVGQGAARSAQRATFVEGASGSRPPALSSRRRGEQKRIVVSGLIAQYPMGGVTWDYIQYVLGLVALGHDVFYLEDSEQWPYHPVRAGCGRDAVYNARYLAEVMARFGLGDRWAYRFPGGSTPAGEIFAERWYGASERRRLEALANADLLINVSSGIGDPARYRHVPRLAYVDTDPVFTQIRAVQDERVREHIDVHDVHFSYGERLANGAPDTGHRWLPLRKPISLDAWRPESPRRHVFTTVMNWTSYHDVRWNGRSYGQKDGELLRFIDLPGRVAPTRIELALGSGITRRAPRDRLLERGWLLADPMRVCADLEGYRAYIESSLGEWTVAKSGYVVGQVGWFSGRTACYLAAGRPVVVQDTGFESVLPEGIGIVAFETLDEAAAAVREVTGDWARHARAAREIAAEYFDARKVVGRLIDEALAVVTGPRPGEAAP